jgi:hypothetical protein
MQRDGAVATTPRRHSNRLFFGDSLVLAGFTALAVYTRYRPLAPHSLFLDDAWMSVGYRAHGVSQLARTTFTAPLFSIATDLWLKAVGLTSLRAQMLAFVAGVVAPALLYLVARSMRLSRAAALVAGALLVFAPLHVSYSSRVKEYTLDALLTVAILFVAWRGLEAPTRRRFMIVTATAVAASIASLTVAPVVAGAFAALDLQALRRRSLRRVALAATATYAAAAGVWYVAVIRPASNVPLRNYWQRQDGFWTDDHLRLHTELHGALSHIARGFSALPPTLTIVLLGFATVVAFTRSIERALLLVVPCAIALVLSAARIAPVGGRVDIYLYPTFALLLAFALDPLLRLTGWFTVVPVALVAMLLALTPLPHYYPQENIAPLVATLEARAAPTDPIVVYRMGLWGFALYSRWPVHIVRDSTDAVPFMVDVGRPDLYEVSGGRPLRLADTLEDEHRVDRVWFIGSHGRVATIADEQHTLEAAGFRLVSRLGDHDAWLDEFERAPRRGSSTV